MLTMPSFKKRLIVEQFQGNYLNAPISVKPEGGGGLATDGNLTVAYIPRVGILIGHHAFDLSI